MSKPRGGLLPDTYRTRLEPASLKPFVEGFGESLVALGHTDWTVRQYVYAALHFAHWVGHSHVTLVGADEGIADQFAHHHCQCSRQQRLDQVSEDYVIRVRRFVRYLAECGARRLVFRRSDYDSLNDRSSRHQGQTSVGWTNPSNSLRRNTRPVGTTVARVRELENIRSFLTGSALTLVIDTLFAGVFIAVMFYYSATLAWVVVTTIPLYLALSLIVSPMLKRRVDLKFRHGAENQSFLVEAVGAVETCKSMAVEPQMQRKWEDLLAAYVDASFKVQNLGSIASQCAQALSKAQTVLILWLGAKAVMEGSLTIGALVAFNMMAGRVAAPILRMAQLWQDFQQMRVSVDRLGDILNTPTERQNAARSALPDLKGRVTFENVSFRYRPDRPQVLHGLSLDVAPGECIGIVGTSGSGKSTLARLIQRLFLPESGRVLIDGVDLALIDTGWLRRQIGVVLQENVLFNRSVRDNIALSDPARPMEHVVASAKAAAAHDFILELPEAYDTQLVERGSNLSGGQRQRIAIARALMNNPQILIMDEATAALDYESEAIIRTNLAEICRGRTVFMIAHRLSTIRHCDRIIVMDKGMIVEEGPHDELLAMGGRYSRLWFSQEAGPAAA